MAHFGGKTKHKTKTYGYVKDIPKLVKYMRLTRIIFLFKVSKNSNSLTSLCHKLDFSIDFGVF